MESSSACQSPGGRGQDTEGGDEGTIIMKGLYFLLSHFLARGFFGSDQHVKRERLSALDLI